MSKNEERYPTKKQSFSLEKDFIFGLTALGIGMFFDKLFLPIVQGKAQMILAFSLLWRLMLALKDGLEKGQPLPSRLILYVERALKRSFEFRPTKSLKYCTLKLLKVN